MVKDAMLADIRDEADRIASRYRDVAPESGISIETAFSYPGLATLIVQGVQTRDFALIQSLGMIFCLVYVVLMMLADVGATLSNPRLRHPK